MAKATAAGGGGRRGRPPTATPARADRASYVVEVYQELRKTTWPTPRELRRMTEVVIATVVLFGLLIGGLDLLLSEIVKPIYTQIGTTQPSASPQQTFTPVPRTTQTPAVSPGAAASGSASGTSSAASTAASGSASSTAAGPAPASPSP